MNIVEPLDLAAPESPQNQQSVGTKGVNHMSHHAIEHRLVLQRRVVVALRKRFVMRVCCDS